MIGRAARRNRAIRGLHQGATARGHDGKRWEELYAAAIGLVVARARALVAELDTIRQDVIARGLQDARTLRAAVGPALPVRLDGTKVG